MTTNIEKKCFVLMPFQDKLKEIYTDVYVPVCLSNNFHCWRVDEIARPGSITRDIVEGILDADIIIADLTTRNANVFYELGIAHATSNKTITTAQSMADVPFDIASYRVIFYEHTLNGCKQLAHKLDLAIKELVAALDRTNNPFQEVLASRGGSRIRQKIPLIKLVNYPNLTRPLRVFLQEQGAMYAEDLQVIDLQSLISKPGFGRDSLSQLCTIILHYDLYKDFGEFQTFIMENRIDTNKAARFVIND